LLYSQFIRSIGSANNTRQLVDQVTKDTYQEIPESAVASIIKEHYDVKVTDTLIESYIELASSGMFSIDPVVLQIRTLNKLDRIFEGKLHYTLDDGTIVAINEVTQGRLNILFAEHKDVVEYMRESKNNFFHVISRIEG